MLTFGFNESNIWTSVSSEIRADVMIIRWVYVFGFSALCLHFYSLKYKGENENEAVRL